MDVEDKGNYQIEVGLSAEDVEKLRIRGRILSRGILTGAERITIHALSEEERDRMIPENERMTAEIKYHPTDYSTSVLEEVVKERQRRDKVYAKYFDNGDVDVYMSEETSCRINPDGIIEINAKMPQISEFHPDNYVKIFVKIPF